MPRKVAVIIGSKNDKSQCTEGFAILRQAVADGQILMVDRRVSSIHLNTQETLDHIKMMVRECVDVLITGAGMANHLSGTTDAYLRNHLKNDRMVVIGVAFEGQTDEDNQAAILSITRVPGTQVVYKDDAGIFFGNHGFLRACQFAIEGNLPLVHKPQPRVVEKFTLEEALAEVSSQ